MSYLRQKTIQAFTPQINSPLHIIFCFVDHYEPDWNQADFSTQKKRVQTWVELFPKFAEKHIDCDGCSHRHTFFYPIEVYSPEHLSGLEKICRDDSGEVEIHLHHENDTEESLAVKLKQGIKDLNKHGFLGKDKETNKTCFGFIHGNWCLNNSRSDGRWCGVNNESEVLKKLGCYADFTFPSAPSETQPQTINSIYYDLGNKKTPKSHNKGVAVEVGKKPSEGLIIVQGPLALNWKMRKKGIFPRIENADICYSTQPSLQRIPLWIDQRISVKGKPEWIFVKVHTHGAPEKNAETVLGESMHKALTFLEENYNDRKNYFLHYVSAREMYNLIKAAEAGEMGEPGEYRDYEIIKN